MPVEPQTSRATPPALGPYSPAVRVGPWLILSGQLGLDPETGTLVDGGAEAQTARAMKTISAVLAEHDLSVAAIAKTTIFVTDLASFQAINEAYATALDGHRPARSTVQVAALPAGGLVEIEVWAWAEG
ncbi:MAG: Rid family detoxifying hydrolase [Acidimicrobiia bacterium]|jgi:2-iminobutanoate/2-iminopropanoate deaminase|nr:Rid family detoxifying hydrolase [Acidimicrobiia bacterium]MBP8179636.1 Rid family detoxifying hydrolase [Acidimicrobiia bacterium]